MGTDDGETARRQTLSGPQSARVAERVEEVRKDRRLTLAQLADRMAAVGHPLRSTALHKIEQGQRRVDVSDLVALALALDVSPNTLLLPATAEETARIALTEGVETDEAKAWRWARGEEGGELVAPDPERPSAPPAGADRGRWMYARRQARQEEFQRNRPDAGRDPSASDVLPHYSDLQALWLRAYELAKATGWSVETVLRLARRAEPADVTNVQVEFRPFEGGDDGR